MTLLYSFRFMNAGIGKVENSSFFRRSRDLRRSMRIVIVGVGRIVFGVFYMLNADLVSLRRTSKLVKQLVILFIFNRLIYIRFSLKRKALSVRVFIRMFILNSVILYILRVVKLMKMFLKVVEKNILMFFWGERVVLGKISVYALNNRGWRSKILGFRILTLVAILV